MTYTRTFVSLVHELEQLVDDGLQELPMRLEESRVLADDIPRSSMLNVFLHAQNILHDVGGNDRLVILPALHLCQSEEILNDGNKEAFLSLLIYVPSCQLWVRRR